MNKILILSVLQLGVLGAILYVLLDGEQQVQESERPSIRRAEAVHEVRPVARAAIVDAESIRQIVRSELSEFADQLSGPATGPEADASDIDPLERDARLAEVRERLAFYRSVGQISDREIDEIQRNISTLDLASQKAVLSELYQEIIAGLVSAILFAATAQAGFGPFIEDVLVTDLGEGLTRVEGSLVGVRSHQIPDSDTGKGKSK